MKGRKGRKRKGKTKGGGERERDQTGIVFHFTNVQSTREERNKASPGGLMTTNSKQVARGNEGNRDK